MTVSDILLVFCYALWFLGLGTTFICSMDGIHWLLESYRVPFNRFRIKQAKQFLVVAAVAMVVAVSSTFGIQSIRETALPQLRFIAIGVLVLGIMLGWSRPAVRTKRRQVPH